MATTVRISWRKLTPAQEEAIRIAVRAGASKRALAEAYGVHKRTVLRILQRAPQECHEVTLAGYRATFVVDELGPIQRTPWMAAP